MRFKPPLIFTDLETLKKRAKFFSSKIKYRKESKLGEDLKNSNIDISREEYLGMSLRTTSFAFLILLVIFNTVLAILGVRFFYLYSVLLSLIFSGLVFFVQSIYPRIYVARRQRNIEQNLIPALQDILIQLNSGVPLFGVMVNISSADYGELSIEFKKAVKRINSGEPEVVVFDDLGKRNPSVLFRRSLWQISNGMRAGGDLSIVIENSIKALNEEQLIQIQNYGNKLNPLVVFYMLIAVIIPSLSIAFLTIISSMINLPSRMTVLVFVALFVFVFLIQIMFLGLIKSRKPTLL